MLFSERSIWTMVHGVGLGGGALLLLAAALYFLIAARTAEGAVWSSAGRSLGRLLVAHAVLLWLTVLIGTYVVFPPYRTAPPAGTTELGAYPKALVQSDPETTWLHSFGMESKEHLPWIAAMLATAVAFVAVRERDRLLADPSLHGSATVLLAICGAVVVFVSLLGVFVNKVAPLE